MGEDGHFHASMFRMKVHRRGGEVLLAASDAALVGESFQEGRMGIEVTEAFYGSDPVGEEALLEQLQACTVANLVGEEVVTLAVRHDLVDVERVLSIDGVPHAQIALMDGR